jgi:hypothetical protein
VVTKSTAAGIASTATIRKNRTTRSICKASCVGIDKDYDYMAAPGGYRYQRRRDHQAAVPALLRTEAGMGLPPAAAGGAWLASRAARTNPSRASRSRGRRRLRHGVAVGVPGAGMASPLRFVLARLDDAAVHHNSRALLEPGNLPARLPANSGRAAGQATALGERRGQRRS